MIGTMVMPDRIMSGWDEGMRQGLIDEAQRLLVERLTSVGAADLIGFTAECLRSCSKRAERLTGALRLEHIDEMARPEH